jgi:hypothetical protein
MPITKYLGMRWHSGPMLLTNSSHNPSQIRKSCGCQERRIHNDRFTLILHFEYQGKLHCAKAQVECAEQVAGHRAIDRTTNMGAAAFRHPFLWKKGNHPGTHPLARESVEDSAAGDPRGGHADPICNHELSRPSSKREWSSTLSGGISLARHLPLHEPQGELFEGMQAP